MRVSRRNRARDAAAQPGTEQPAAEAARRARMAREGAARRWCLDWLQQLEQGETVVVTLRPDTEITPYVCGVILPVCSVYELR